MHTHSWCTYRLSDNERAAHAAHSPNNGRAMDAGPLSAHAAARLLLQRTHGGEHSAAPSPASSRPSSAASCSSSILYTSSGHWLDVATTPPPTKPLHHHHHHHHQTQHLARHHLSNEIPSASADTLTSSSATLPKHKLGVPLVAPAAPAAAVYASSSATAAVAAETVASGATHTYRTHSTTSDDYAYATTCQQKATHSDTQSPALLLPTTTTASHTTPHVWPSLTLQLHREEDTVIAAPAAKWGITQFDVHVTANDSNDINDSNDNNDLRCETPILPVSLSPKSLVHSARVRSASVLSAQSDVATDSFLPIEVAVLLNDAFRSHTTSRGSYYSRRSSRSSLSFARTTPPSPSSSSPSSPTSFSDSSSLSLSTASPIQSLPHPASRALLVDRSLSLTHSASQTATSFPCTTNLTQRTRFSPEPMSTYGTPTLAPHAITSSSSTMSASSVAATTTVSPLDLVLPTYMGNTTHMNGIHRQTLDDTSSHPASSNGNDSGNNNNSSSSSSSSDSSSNNSGISYTNIYQVEPTSAYTHVLAHDRPSRVSLIDDIPRIEHPLPVDFSASNDSIAVEKWPSQVSQTVDSHVYDSRVHANAFPSNTVANGEGINAHPKESMFSSVIPPPAPTQSSQRPPRQLRVNTQLHPTRKDSDCDTSSSHTNQKVTPSFRSLIGIDSSVSQLSTATVATVVDRTFDNKPANSNIYQRPFTGEANDFTPPTYESKMRVSSQSNQQERHSFSRIPQNDAAVKVSSTSHSISSSQPHSGRSAHTSSTQFSSPLRRDISDAILPTAMSSPSVSPRSTTFSTSMQKQTSSGSQDVMLQHESSETLEHERLLDLSVASESSSMKPTTSPKNVSQRPRGYTLPTPSVPRLDLSQDEAFSPVLEHHRNISVFSSMNIQSPGSRRMHSPVKGRGSDVTGADSIVPDDSGSEADNLYVTSYVHMPDLPAPYSSVQPHHFDASPVELAVAELARRQEIHRDDQNNLNSGTDWRSTFKFHGHSHHHGSNGGTSHRNGHHHSRSSSFISTFMQSVIGSERSSLANGSPALSPGSPVTVTMQGGGPMMSAASTSQPESDAVSSKGLFRRAALNSNRRPLHLSPTSSTPQNRMLNIPATADPTMESRLTYDYFNVEGSSGTQQKNSDELRSAQLNLPAVPIQIPSAQYVPVTESHGLYSVTEDVADMNRRPSVYTGTTNSHRKVSGVSNLNNKQIISLSPSPSDDISNDNIIQGYMDQSWNSFGKVDDKDKYQQELKTAPEYSTFADTSKASLSLTIPTASNTNSYRARAFSDAEAVPSAPVLSLRGSPKRRVTTGNRPENLDIKQHSASSSLSGFDFLGGSYERASKLATDGMDFNPDTRTLSHLSPSIVNAAKTTVITPITDGKEPNSVINMEPRHTARSESVLESPIVYVSRNDTSFGTRHDTLTDAKTGNSEHTANTDDEVLDESMPDIVTRAEPAIELPLMQQSHTSSSGQGTDDRKNLTFYLKILELSEQAYLMSLDMLLRRDYAIAKSFVESRAHKSDYRWIAENINVGQSNVERIIACHRCIAADNISSIKQLTTLTFVVRSHIDELFDAYSQFVSNFPSSIAALQALDSKPQFRAYIEKLGDLQKFSYAEPVENENDKKPNEQSTTKERRASGIQSFIHKLKRKGGDNNNPAPVHNNAGSGSETPLPSYERPRKASLSSMHSNDSSLSSISGSIMQFISSTIPKIKPRRSSCPSPIYHKEENETVTSVLGTSLHSGWIRDMLNLMDQPNKRLQFWQRILNAISSHYKGSQTNDLYSDIDLRMEMLGDAIAKFNMLVDGIQSIRQDAYNHISLRLLITNLDRYWGPSLQFLGQLQMSTEVAIYREMEQHTALSNDHSNVNLSSEPTPVSMYVFDRGIILALLEKQPSVVSSPTKAAHGKLSPSSSWRNSQKSSNRQPRISSPTSARYSVRSSRTESFAESLDVSSNGFSRNASQDTKLFGPSHSTSATPGKCIFLNSHILLSSKVGISASPDYVNGIDIEDRQVIQLSSTGQINDKRTQYDLASKSVMTIFLENQAQRDQLLNLLFKHLGENDAMFADGDSVVAYREKGVPSTPVDLRSNQSNDVRLSSNLSLMTLMMKRVDLQFLSAEYFGERKKHFSEIVNDILDAQNLEAQKREANVAASRKKSRNSTHGSVRSLKSGTRIKETANHKALVVSTNYTTDHRLSRLLKYKHPEKSLEPPKSAIPLTQPSLASRSAGHSRSSSMSGKAPQNMLPLKLHFNLSSSTKGSAGKDEIASPALSSGRSKVISTKGHEQQTSYFERNSKYLENTDTTSVRSKDPIINTAAEDTNSTAMSPLKDTSMINSFDQTKQTYGGVSRGLPQSWRGFRNSLGKVAKIDSLCCDVSDSSSTSKTKRLSDGPFSVKSEQTFRNKNGPSTPSVASDNIQAAKRSSLHEPLSKSHRSEMVNVSKKANSERFSHPCGGPSAASSSSSSSSFLSLRESEGLSKSSSELSDIYKLGASRTRASSKTVPSRDPGDFDLEWDLSSTNMSLTSTRDASRRTSLLMRSREGSSIPSVALFKSASDSTNQAPSARVTTAVRCFSDVTIVTPGISAESSAEGDSVDPRDTNSAAARDVLIMDPASMALSRSGSAQTLALSLPSSTDVLQLSALASPESSEASKSAASSVHVDEHCHANDTPFEGQSTTTNDVSRRVSGASQKNMEFEPESTFGIRENSFVSCSSNAHNGIVHSATGAAAAVRGKKDGASGFEEQSEAKRSVETVSSETAETTIGARSRFGLQKAVEPAKLCETNERGLPIAGGNTSPIKCAQPPSVQRANTPTAALVWAPPPVHDDNQHSLDNRPEKMFKAFGISDSNSTTAASTKMSQKCSSATGGGECQLAVDYERVLKSNLYPSPSNDARNKLSPLLLPGDRSSSSSTGHGENAKKVLHRIIPKTGVRSAPAATESVAAPTKHVVALDPTVNSDITQLSASLFPNVPNVDEQAALDIPVVRNRAALEQRLENALYPTGKPSSNREHSGKSRMSYFNHLYIDTEQGFNSTKQSSSSLLKGLIPHKAGGRSDSQDTNSSLTNSLEFMYRPFEGGEENSGDSVSHSASDDSFGSVPKLFSASGSSSSFDKLSGLKLLRLMKKEDGRHVSTSSVSTHEGTYGSGGKKSMSSAVKKFISSATSIGKRKSADGLSSNFISPDLLTTTDVGSVAGDRSSMSSSVPPLNTSGKNAQGNTPIDSLNCVISPFCEEVNDVLDAPSTVSLAVPVVKEHQRAGNPRVTTAIQSDEEFDRQQTMLLPSTIISCKSSSVLSDYEFDQNSSAQSVSNQAGSSSCSVANFQEFSEDGVQTMLQVPLTKVGESESQAVSWKDMASNEDSLVFPDDSLTARFGPDNITVAAVLAPAADRE